MSAVGFEPTRIAPPELESGALDRSAKLSSTSSQFQLQSDAVDKKYSFAWKKFTSSED